MIERITEKEMMQRINHVKEQLILTQGEGDMRFQEFRKWVRNQISEWYDNNEDYKKEIEEEDERLNERFGAETFEADTPDPINPEYIEEAVQNLPKEQYLEFCDYFEIDPNDEKELSQFLQKNRNDSNVLMKLDVLNLDAWYDSRYGSYGSLFRAENFEAERYKPTPKEIRFLVRNLRAVWTKYERGVYDEDEVLDKTGSILYHTGVMQEEYVAEGFEAEVDFAYYQKYLNYEKNGTPIEKDGYELSWGLAELNRKELIEEILGSFEYDYLLENNMVRKIDDGEEKGIWFDDGTKLTGKMILQDGYTFEEALSIVSQYIPDYEGMSNEEIIELMKDEGIDDLAEDELYAWRESIANGDEVGIRNLKALMMVRQRVSEIYPENFEASGIDTFTEPFTEMKTGSILKKAILLGSLGVGAFVGNKLRK